MNFYGTHDVLNDGNDAVLLEAERLIANVSSDIPCAMSEENVDSVDASDRSYVDLFNDGMDDVLNISMDSVETHEKNNREQTLLRLANTKKKLIENNRNVALEKLTMTKKKHLFDANGVNQTLRNHIYEWPLKILEILFAKQFGHYSIVSR